MTEKQALYDYIKANGEAIPAKLHGKVWMGHFFGSEVTRRARDLRKEGKVVSEKEGKFEKFYLPQGQAVLFN